VTDVEATATPRPVLLTVDDEGVFTMPWTATITYRRNVGEWTELICAENPREFDRKESTAPRADKPDF
jgi:hypothetical protein